MEEWAPEDIKAHMDYYEGLNKELSDSGELLDGHALTGPELAKVVTSDGATAPVVTDGPFAEFKEMLAGYQLVDVESEERAIEIAAKISQVPGPRRPRPLRRTRVTGHNGTLDDQQQRQLRVKIRDADRRTVGDDAHQ